MSTRLKNTAQASTVVTGKCISDNSSIRKYKRQDALTFLELRTQFLSKKFVVLFTYLQATVSQLFVVDGHVSQLLNVLHVAVLIFNIVKEMPV